MDKTARINALMASKKLGPAITAKFLEGLPEESLKAIEDSVAAAPTDPPVVVPPVATPVPVASASGLTDEDRDILREAREARAAKRTGFVTAIKANKGNEFSDAELEAMPITTLERLSKLVAQPVAVPANTGQVDFSGIGLPRVAAGADTSIPAAPNMITAIQDHRKAKAN